METIEYHTIDKSTWGDGPWQNEPDEVQYSDPETGYACEIMRNSQLGNLCGYVAVPESHPYFSKSYEDIDISVHGGLTFANFFKGKDKNLWWFGFDCAHYMDASPGLQAILGDLGWDRESTDIYRDIPYVKSQIASLAKQLKALETQ